MSLKPQAISPVPAETTRVAQVAYPKGNVCMHMRDMSGSISTDEDFADLFPKDGQPAEALVVTSDRRKPISNMSPQQPLSTCFAVWHG